MSNTTPAPRRFSDALAIIEGACNPSGICHSIIDAQAEIYAADGGTNQVYQDPAVRLMVQQLAYLCEIHAMDRDLAEYGRCIDLCKQHEKEEKS